MKKLPDPVDPRREAQVFKLLTKAFEVFDELGTLLGEARLQVMRNEKGEYVAILPPLRRRGRRRR